MIVVQLLLAANSSRGKVFLCQWRTTLVAQYPIVLWIHSPPSTDLPTIRILVVHGRPVNLSMLNDELCECDVHQSFGFLVLQGLSTQWRTYSSRADSHRNSRVRVDFEYASPTFSD